MAKHQRPQGSNVGPPTLTKPSNLIDALFKEPADSSAFCGAHNVPAPAGSPASSPAPAGSVPYQELFQECGAEWGIPWQILAGLASTENSSFNPSEIGYSNSGKPLSFGIMQVEAKRFVNGQPVFQAPTPLIAHKGWNINSSNWQDPQTNICAGAAVLSYWLHRQGNITNALYGYKGILGAGGANYVFKGGESGRDVINQVLASARSLGWSG